MGKKGDNDHKQEEILRSEEKSICLEWKKIIIDRKRYTGVVGTPKILEVFEG